jgi:predicted nucleotide-binding protein
MSEYETYSTGLFSADKEFTVFIIHGHAPDWRIVERFINKKLNFKTIVLQETYRSGETIIEKLESLLEECDCAVAIMSPDDKMIDGTFRARPNVIYEMGYCDGSMHRERLIVMKEKTVDIHSDLHGLVYIPYEDGHIESAFSQLAEGLNEIFDEM